MMPGKKPVKQRRPGAANMQMPRRTGGKSCPYHQEFFSFRATAVYILPFKIQAGPAIAYSTKITCLQLKKIDV
jgi:hypothetical protein